MYDPKNVPRLIILTPELLTCPTFATTGATLAVGGAANDVSCIYRAEQVRITKKDWQKYTSRRMLNPAAPLNIFCDLAVMPQGANAKLWYLGPSSARFRFWTRHFINMWGDPRIRSPRLDVDRYRALEETFAFGIDNDATRRNVVAFQQSEIAEFIAYFGDWLEDYYPDKIQHGDLTPEF